MSTATALGEWVTTAGRKQMSQSLGCGPHHLIVYLCQLAADASWVW